MIGLLVELFCTSRIGAVVLAGAPELNNLRRPWPRPPPLFVPLRHPLRLTHPRAEAERLGSSLTPPPSTSAPPDRFRPLPDDPTPHSSLPPPPLPLPNPFLSFSLPPLPHSPPLPVYHGLHWCRCGPGRPSPRPRLGVQLALRLCWRSGRRQGGCPRRGCADDEVCGLLLFRSACRHCVGWGCVAKHACCGPACVDFSAVFLRF